MGNDPEEALQECATGNADAVAKVAIALATGSVVVRKLTEIGR